MTPHIKGITLLELLVTIAVLAILAGIGVPSFVDFMAKSRVNAVANDLATAVLSARSEAVKTRGNAKLCPRAASGSAVCSTTASWNNGWAIVPVDISNNQITGSSPSLFRDPPSGKITLSGPKYITFVPIGSAQFETGDTNVFTITHGSPCIKKTVTVSPAGSTTVADVAC